MKYYSLYKQDTSCDLELVIIDRLEEFWDSIDGETVRGEGTIRPIIMFVGLSPSDHDFETNVPFSDAPGQKLIGVISYIAANLKDPLEGRVYRTFLCAEKDDEDLELCTKRLEDEIKLVNPQIIVFIGEGGLLQGRTNVEKDEVLKIGDKYFNTYWLPCLRQLFFKRDETAPIMKERLDHIINELNK